MTAPRDRQRGNTLLLALIVMSALATLGSLTVVSVQSSLKASTNDRSQTVAMYAAESGAAVAMDHLRTQLAAGSTAYVSASNNPPLPRPGFPSNGALPGTAANLLSADQNASYTVEILNNPGDPGFAAGRDDDQRVIIRSTGHGPQGSTVILEWEVALTPPLPPPPPPPLPPPPPPLTLLGWHVVM